MGDIIFGMVICWVLLATWPEARDIFGVVVIASSIFVGGWNWHKFAVKRGWIAAISGEEKKRWTFNTMTGKPEEALAGEETSIDEAYDNLRRRGLREIT